MTLVTSISGFGNLYSSDYRINEVFGIEEEYVSSFNGPKLSEDITLIVSGELTIKIVYKSIDGGFSGRIYDMSSAINLSTGNFKAGKISKSVLITSWQFQARAIFILMKVM